MSKRALANQERAAQAQRLGRLGQSAILLIATVLLFSTMGLLAADQLYRPDTFVIDQLKIKGKFKHLNPADVESMVQQQPLGNFFTIDLQDIKQRSEQLAWVQRANVRREWPNTLLIELEEQRPIMRWGKNSWVNSYGEVVELPSAIKYQPKISLNGNPKDAKMMMRQALQWQQLMVSSGLDLVGLSLSDSHAYRLQISQSPNTKPFALLLGRREIDERLTRFLMLYDTQLRTAGQQLIRVDARYPDGLAINAQKIEPADSLVLNQTGAGQGEPQ